MFQPASINIQTGSTSQSTTQQANEPGGGGGGHYQLVSQPHHIYTGAATNDMSPYFDQSVHSANPGQDFKTSAGVAENSAQNFISTTDFEMTNINDDFVLLEHENSCEQPSSFLGNDQQHPQEHQHFSKNEHQPEPQTYHNHYDEFDHYHQYFESQPQQQSQHVQDNQQQQQQTFPSPEQPLHHSFDNLSSIHSPAASSNYADPPCSFARSCDDISSKQHDTLDQKVATIVHTEPTEQRKTIWDVVSKDIDPKMSFSYALFVILLAVASIMIEDEVSFTYVQVVLSFFSLGVFIKMGW
ncbi:hypothetical protein HELRODRAFT_192629 [Helobdella robusta]|uniref:Uncharacterized protein n=1 Tax=Helobdella robusta TaxID=6412 RepID=T1FU51_HELRO|nr:hypothetical protein HELRODRAFT_192629 [Helobdella robusta]ESO00205.1 hypothetical protein HELRODRAFT_192629 [Helobdella robusta]